MSITHLLNREVGLYRYEATRNDTGGLIEERKHLRDIWVRISQPSVTERVLARTGVGPQQGGADTPFPAYTEPDEDVQRNDELEDPATGEVYRVKGLLRPSQDCVYLRMDCTYVQAEDVIGGDS